MLSFLAPLMAKPAEPIEAVGNVLDALFTSDKERLGKQAILARIAQQPQLVQTEINRTEAGHKSLFVAAGGLLSAGCVACRFYIISLFGI